MREISLYQRVQKLKIPSDRSEVTSNLIGWQRAEKLSEGAEKGFGTPTMSYIRGERTNGGLFVCSVLYQKATLFLSLNDIFGYAFELATILMNNL